MRVGLRIFRPETITWLRAALRQGQLSRAALGRGVCGREDWRNPKGEYCTASARKALRASELINLRCGNVQLGTGAHVRCEGKGRKERCTPLRKDSVAALRTWLEERRGAPDAPVFPNRRGGVLTHDGLAYVLAKHLAMARKACPSLAGKRVTPHVLRHSAAMELLQNGVDRNVIELWLGHESVETTYVYLHANLKLKEAAMAKTTPSQVPSNRYHPDDELLAFLNSL